MQIAPYSFKEGAWAKELMEVIGDTVTGNEKKFLHISSIYPIVTLILPFNSSKKIPSNTKVLKIRISLPDTCA